MTPVGATTDGYLTVICVMPDDDDRAIVGLSLDLDTGIAGYLAASVPDCRAIVTTGIQPDLMLIAELRSDDGLSDLVREIGHADRPETPPFIVLTNDVQSQDVRLLHELGAIGVVGVPFDPFALAANIRLIWRTYTQADDRSGPPILS